MEKFNLKDMIGGWFIGNFNPSLYHTNEVEVAVKRYKLGDKAKAHYHKISTEFTVILDGKVRMSGNVFSSGDIIKIFDSVSQIESELGLKKGARNLIYRCLNKKMKTAYGYKWEK